MATAVGIDASRTDISVAKRLCAQIRSDSERCTMATTITPSERLSGRGPETDIDGSLGDADLHATTRREVRDTASATPAVRLLHFMETRRSATGPSTAHHGAGAGGCPTPPVKSPVAQKFPDRMTRVCTETTHQDPSWCCCSSSTA
jgi:hypothetical protein